MGIDDPLNIAKGMGAICLGIIVSIYGGYTLGNCNATSYGRKEGIQEEASNWTQGRKNLQGKNVTPSDLSNVVVCFPDDATQRDLYLLSPTGVHGFRPDTDGNNYLSLDKHIEPERDCISLADYMQR